MTGLMGEEGGCVKGIIGGGRIVEAVDKVRKRGEVGAGHRGKMQR